MMKKQYKYLISYIFSDDSSWGFGNVTKILNKKMSEEYIERITIEIVDEKKFKECTIINFCEIE